MVTSEDTFKEFAAYWRVAERMIDKAGKDDIAEVARILALQTAAYTRRFGELPLEDHAELLKATESDFEATKLLKTEEGARMLGLLRDGMEALVGVLAVVTDGIGEEAERPIQ